MEKLKPRAVIFDLGSTLIEYESIPCSELSVIASRSVWSFLTDKGFKVPPEEEFIDTFEYIKNEFRKPARENLTEWSIPQAAERLLAEFGIESQDGLVKKLFQAYYRPVAEQIYAYDDTAETLERVKRRGMVVGLISNTIFPEQTHRDELKKFKLHKFFDFAIFSSTFGVRKPHPDIFCAAANMAGSAPAECVYVGDRYVEDYRGPTEVGMPAVLKIVRYREYPQDLLGEIPTINSLSELTNYIDI
ncbi:MAG: HAD-IA family hydrolase [Candidatus Zixiibacteriota bacterium]|nr:MAG: HAD-IA family hydrolase [candidate division Zixibacteria bacterium]